MSGGRDVSLKIFITSMSSSKSATFFASRIFHFKETTRRVVAERNGKFGHIHYQRSKESSSREKSILLQKVSESQSHPNELSEYCRKETVYCDGIAEKGGQ